VHTSRCVHGHSQVIVPRTFGPARGSWWIEAYTIPRAWPHFIACTPHSESTLFVLSQHRGRTSSPAPSTYHFVCHARQFASRGNVQSSHIETHEVLHLLQIRATVVPLPSKGSVCQALSELVPPASVRLALCAVGMPRYYCDYCDNYLTHDSVCS
jgi:hypothetical protein